MIDQIGTFKLSEKCIKRRTFEVARWFQDIECEPQQVPAVMYASWQITAKLHGTVVDSDMQSLFFGVPCGQTWDRHDVGKQGFVSELWDEHSVALSVLQDSDNSPWKLSPGWIAYWKEGTYQGEQYRIPKLRRATMAEERLNWENFEEIALTVVL